MRVYFGKGPKMWVVSKKSGSVRQISINTLCGLVISIVLGSATATAFLVHQDALVRRAKVLLTPSNELLEQNRALASALQEARHREIETRRLQAKVEHKLDSLRGLVEGVSEESSGALPLEKGKNSLFRNTSLATIQLDGDVTGAGARERNVQRQQLRRLEHLVRQLRGLPLRLPVEGGKFSSGFGYRVHPIWGHTHFHQGLDISFGRDRRILATGNGVVKSIGASRGYGFTVEVQHTPTVTTRYAHLSYATVKTGQRIKAGDVIAFGGASGATTGSHLHYEVRIRGRARDPKIFLDLNQKIQFALREINRVRG